MKYLILFCISFFCTMGYVQAQKTYTVSGKVVDSTGTPLVGVIVRTSDGSIGSATDADGLFKLQLPKGQFTIIISTFGYKEQQKIIQVDNNIMLAISMEEDLEMSDEVVITGKAPNDNVVNTKMGATEITVEEILK